MRKNHVQHLFIDALDNQLTDDQKLSFYDHLKKCQTCADEFNDLKAIVKHTHTVNPPEPADSFWSHYWMNLQSKLDQPKRLTQLSSRLASFSIERYLKIGLAAAAVVIISLGLYFGELNFRVFSVKPVAKIDDVQATAQSFLELSKIVLTSFSNVEPTETARIPNFQQQKALSRKLVNQSARLKEELDPSAQKRIINLIDDLEVVLMQIAAMDSTYDLNTLEMIQYSVEQKSILFKLNLQDVSTLKDNSIKKNEDI